MPTTATMAAELAKVCRICRYADGVCTIGFRKTQCAAFMVRLPEWTVPPARAKASARPAQEPPFGEQGEEGHQPRTVGEELETAGHDQMTLFETRKRLHMQYPAGPAGQMDSPGHSAQSRGRLRGQYRGGNTKHRRKRRVRTVPGTLPQAMQAWGKGRPACAHCRPLHAPDSRGKQNLRHAVSGQGGEDVAKGPGSAERSGQGEGSSKGKQPHRQRTSHQRCSDLPIWGRMPSSTMTEVLWKTLLQIGGQPRGLGHGRD